jgi:hypothetical protein
MNYIMQAKAFQLLERLINNGHGLNNLPIDTQRAKGIIEMREPATEADLRVLELAAKGTVA